MTDASGEIADEATGPATGGATDDGGADDGASTDAGSADAGSAAPDGSDKIVTDTYGRDADPKSWKELGLRLVWRWFDQRNIVAIPLLIMFVWLVSEMFGAAGDNWDRKLVLYDGMLVFGGAAVGVALGVSVTTPRVKQAKDEATTAQRDKRDAETKLAQKSRRNEQLQEHVGFAEASALAAAQPSTVNPQAAIPGQRLRSGSDASVVPGETTVSIVEQIQANRRARGS